MAILPNKIQALAEALRALPQIGPRQAIRTAVFLFRNAATAETLTQALANLSDGTLTCERCFRISEENPCAICTNANRDATLLLVLEEDTDLEQIEQTGAYKGKYFVLGGRFSTSRGTSLDQGLRVDELRRRLQEDKERLQEVILAISPTSEGEALLAELGRIVKEAGITSSQLGRGLPVGGEVEYADEETLRSALENRG